MKKCVVWVKKGSKKVLKKYDVQPLSQKRHIKPKKLYSFKNMLNKLVNCSCT